MSQKLLMTALVIAGLGLVFTSTADARGRRCGGGYSGGYYTETAQAYDGNRLYSYEPTSDSGYYVRPRSSSRPNTPVYLLPKSDPGKYDPR